MDSGRWYHFDPDRPPEAVTCAGIRLQPSTPLSDISHLGMPIGGLNEDDEAFEDFEIEEEEDEPSDVNLPMEEERNENQVPGSGSNTPIVAYCFFVSVVPQVASDSESDEEEPLLETIQFKIIIEGRPSHGEAIADQIKETINAPGFTILDMPEIAAYLQSVTIQVKWNKEVEDLFWSIIDAFYGIPSRPRLLLDDQLLTKEISANQSHQAKTLELHSLYPDGSIRSRWVLPPQLNNALLTDIYFNNDLLIIHNGPNGQDRPFSIEIDISLAGDILVSPKLAENSLTLTLEIGESGAIRRCVVPPLDTEPGSDDFLKQIIGDNPPPGTRLLQLTIKYPEKEAFYDLLCGLHHANGSQLIYQLQQPSQSSWSRMATRASSSQNHPP